MSESQKPSAETNTMEARFQTALDWIERLRLEPFNKATEKKLASHPFVLAAEQGSLSMAQKRAFVGEQLAIQRSDAASFAYLAGHPNFRPKSLATIAQAPEPVRGPFYKDYMDLFQFLLGGELYAANLLLDHANYLGLGGEQAISTACSPLSPLAQAYPSYWARLALNQQRAAGAAACAVNFPAWGSMCGRLAAAYCKTDESLSDGCKELAFIQFFATPIENLNEMAAAIMMQDEEISYEELAEHVRLLQEYELLFWDACYSAK